MLRSQRALAAAALSAVAFTACGHGGGGPAGPAPLAVDVTMARAEILPGIAPGSTAVRVKELLTPEILIEIQSVVAL